tara:strand:- start:30701 stop:32023 length:1323 start_codon:yes stop_codon:yes gene_type:complete
MKKALLISTILLFNFVLLAQKNESVSSEIKDDCLLVHRQWLEEAYILTKNTVGFTAPVSGRAYSYLAIGMYESTVEITPELQSIHSQLDGYDRNTWNDNELDYRLVANSVDYELIQYLYRAMPQSNRERVVSIVDSIENKYAKDCSKKVRKNSIAYGKKLAIEILEWSKKDGGDTGFRNNFPEEFEPPYCPSCWIKTVPGYLPSLLPYWGENKQMLKESNVTTDSCVVFEFSEDSSSFMYHEAMRVLENSKLKDPEYEIIAEYWDDGAGYSGTPTGHFFTIANQIAGQQNLKLDQAMELYVKLGVAVNEAFIAAFRLKYKYNFIRPITYIHRLIDSKFNTRIASPPFPEFPSGHSFQSGAATEIMKSIFGDSLTIVDSTNIDRVDIDGTPRTFSSFTEMSEEVSISRLYGGIHFLKSLDESLKYGRKIGKYVATELKCRK